MKIFVLTDNCAGKRFNAEHGLSFYILHDNCELLLDAGHSNLFLENGARLGVDPRKAAFIVLSHGHWDHGDGLRHLGSGKLICHPGAFRPRYRKDGDKNIGLELTKKELGERFEIWEATEPLFISEQIAFLGEVPRRTAFESLATDFRLGDGSDDFVPDDSGLALVCGDELVVISGCAHAGICNTVEHARAVTGIRKVRAVLGGFHLKGDDRLTRETIAWFKENGIERVFPSHCTELPALAEFHREFGVRQVKSGMALEF
jgi:7,8-dihydropterin-6-yl-methyl-4-(beta-D-ribofuranosyl)aminobenzene 5'-phosphate synthase